MVRLMRHGQACDLWEVELATGGERLAMKYLPAGSRHTKEQVAFLKNEYLVGSQVNHPNVITIDQFETVREGTYLTMELFRHHNLKQWIQQNMHQLPLQLENIIRGAGQGLGQLHRAGWIHRDVKPDNFLMNDQWEVKVIDFNLAQKKKSSLARMFAGRSKVQGTRSYMSPEQIRGQVVDERSDLYSFCCMIHEFFTGRPPFTGSSTQDLLNKHLRTAAPLISVANEYVSPEFCQLVQRSLSKDPQRRPEGVMDFLHEMSQLRVYRRLPPQTTGEESS